MAQRKVNCEVYTDRGIVGKEGAEGKSAYQQAVEGGYQGTEEEFEQALASDIATVANNVTNINVVGNNIENVNTAVDNMDAIIAAPTAATQAAASASQAAASATNAQTSETNAATSATNAQTSETNAATSASNAASSATNAYASATIATTKASEATLSATSASASATSASESATSASTSATNAQTWAEGADSAVTPLGGKHSAKGWASIAKQYAESIGAALKYKGSVSTYSYLPSTGQEIGDTWNVLDTGDNYAWTGTEWDKLSGTVDLSAYRTSADQDIIDSKKQDTITDLAIIRSGAAAGTTAVQPGDLATVATSGSYTDLTNKPTIPTVNNATLTIQQNGSNITTFTANSSTNTTANITVPTKLSDLTNDSGFVKNGDVLLDVSAHSTANPRHIWQEKLDDCLYRAETRYKVNLTNFDSSANKANLFDGNTDTCCSILAGNTGVVSISGNTNLGLGYPYGYIYCTFYYGGGPRDISDVTCRVYQNWQGHNIGWVTLTGQEVASSTLGGGIKSIDTLRFYTTKHGINQIEITLNNTKGTSTTEGTKMRLCAINFFATRTSIHSLPVLTKFGGDTIYGNVTIPVQLGSFKGNLTGTADKSVKDGDGNTISSTYVKVAQKGVANGVATLDANGKVPTGQIPVATASDLGVVKPDGNTITVTEDGTISATVSGDNVATKSELQDRVAKAGDTMTGQLKMSGENEVRFGTDDNFYLVQCSGNGQLSIFNKNGKGIFLQLEEAHAPFYWNGTNGYRLLTTADLQNLDYVVESYNDGTNWYRKYKSGWIEQGGYVPPNSGNSGTITFLKPFIDNHYTVASNTGNAAANNFFNLSAGFKTATSIPWYKSADVIAGDWIACGQGA